MNDRNLHTKDIDLTIRGEILCIDDSGGIGIEYLDESEAFDCLRRWMYDKRRKNRNACDTQQADLVKERRASFKVVKNDE